MIDMTGIGVGFFEPGFGALMARRSVQTLVERGAKVRTLKKVEPTLEDVFIELVGHGLSDAAAGGKGGAA